ncbi:MAG TPA: TraB/GumN family protein [Rhizomicrobium sp.]
MKRRAALFVLAFLTAFVPARAEAPQTVDAHPALWRVHGEGGTAYLFGSLHMLPPNVNWQTPEIKRAFSHADTYVFEIPLGADTINRVNALMGERGMLPPGQSLRAMLPPDSQADLDKVLASFQLPLTAVDNKRPWLVSLMLASIMAKKHELQDAFGADKILGAQAKASGKPILYLETVDQQLALVAPDDPKVELQFFEAGLKSFATADNDIAAITNAWEKGDIAALDAVTAKEFKDQPDARAAYFTDRNRAWTKQIEAMLRERRTFFIAVGAGHLAGKDGVPALLRADGYKVDGP